MKSDALCKCSGLADLKAVKLRGTRGKKILCNQRTEIIGEKSGKDYKT